MAGVMFMVAPNGARRTKQDHPALPLDPAELATEAASCRGAGAAGIHLHVRDAAGHHSLDPGLYREAIAAVRDATGRDFIIQITTESAGIFSPADQMACIESVRPKAVSLALREFIPDATAEREASRLLSWIEGEGVAVQARLYTPTELTRLIALHDTGIIPSRHLSLLFVLGRYAPDGQSTPNQLDWFVDQLPSGWPVPWMMFAFGRREAECAVHAARLGGHVRIGFENNLHLPDGTMSGSNAQLVAAAAELLQNAGFDLISPAEARTSVIRMAAADS